MTIIYKNHYYCFVDHKEFINLVYKNVSVNEDESVSYIIAPKLFSVADNKNVNNRKRNYNSDKFHEEAVAVKGIYERFIEELPSIIKDNHLRKYKQASTSDVREFAKKIFELTVFNLEGVNGGNNANVALKCKIKENEFLMPSYSRFYCGSIHEQCQKLTGAKFDLVIADPPWWNKYIRRLKSTNDKLSYSMMYNEDIASIPLKDLLSENCLVAIWCTNAPSNIAAVKNLIFPKWGIKYVTTWYWLKVTVELKPMYPFGSGCNKQPYERVIIGKIGDILDIPDSYMCVSVPSALHSHKPPLLDVLSPFLKTEKPKTLELFARYLLPNTTSIGYEPLKWQHISLFEKIS